MHLPVLYEADKMAHEEAVQNGGVRTLACSSLPPFPALTLIPQLIMYWFGVPSPETGLNLATCIWQSRQHAVQANSRPNHVRAAKLAKAAYERYDLERWIVRKVKGETGIRLEPYTEGPVGW